MVSKDFNHSYWELKSWFGIYDLVVVGSGIVGLSAAISFSEKNKKARILVLERGFLPDGASTKNAGFACFGSAGELLDDLGRMPESTVWETVDMRWKGLLLLRKRLGDKNIAYQGLGGYELFNDAAEYAQCHDSLNHLNKSIHTALGLRNCFKVANAKARRFNGVKGALVNSFEGQLDTALMMGSLAGLARSLGIEILNNAEITSMENVGALTELHSPHGVFKARRVIVAVNGFASELLGLKGVKPARAQVLVTGPIEGLKVKGAFHYQQGYYYFRNIDNRILLGGGRNLDFEGETTTLQGLSGPIQNRLDELLATMILPGVKVKVAQRWSGIMGVGSEKKPIIKPVGKRVIAAVRMGGMGVAIGSLVGREAAALASAI